MTLLFTEGFDYATAIDSSAILRHKWDQDTDVGWISRTGRFGGYSSSRNAASPLRKTLPASTTLIIGQAFRPTSITSTGQLLVLTDAGTSQYSVYQSNAGFKAYRGTSTLLGTSTDCLAINTWAYVEIKVKVDSTVGTVDIQVDGVSVLSLSGQNTQATGNNTVDNMVFNYGSTNSYHDDVYVCDDQGSTNNDFLGDVRIETLRPNGNGNSSDFVGSDGNSTDNYLLVDDTQPSSSTYVESSTVTNKDLYTLENLSNTPATIFGVVTNATFQKTDVGNREIKHTVRSGTTDYPQTTHLLSIEWINQQNLLEADPDTAVAWTVSGVNNVEVGYEVTV